VLKLNEMQKEIAKAVVCKETVGEQIRVLVYEVGDLVKCIHYMHRYPQDQSLYKIEAKRALADLLVQAYLTATYLNFDVDELLGLGLDALKERMKDFRSTDSS